jgi:hypothetical protein
VMAREVPFASSGRALRRLLRRAESSPLRAVGVDALDRRGRPPGTLSCFRCPRADELVRPHHSQDFRKLRWRLLPERVEP